METRYVKNETAFPVSDANTALALLNTGVDPTGMSKRFYAACMAMQGLIAGCDVYSGGFDSEWVAKAAFSMADKLLKQENL